MSSIEAAQSDRYALVSSFYGPGAVVGWYLTALACLVSFSLHPRKRTRDSITVDLITVLTFPSIAAADLIVQVRSFPKEGITLAQNAALIGTTLIVIETFLAIDVVLFLLAVGFKCVRRGCLLATVGLFCFSVECYVYFSPFTDPPFGGQLGRLFMIDFGGLLISVMAVLFICIICALSLIALFVLRLPDEPHARLSVRGIEATRREREREVDTRRKHWERDFKESRNAAALSGLTLLFLPCTFLATMFPLFADALAHLPSQFWPLIRTAASRITHGLIPISNTSAKELDQAVALLAGATVLGFSLHSTADSYYQAWLSETRAMAQQRDIELGTLGHVQAPRH